MLYRKSVSYAVALALLLLSMPWHVAARQETEQTLVPRDETFALELLSPLNSKTSQKGDKFDCKVMSPVRYAGAIVSGHVKKAKSSGKANGKSEMDLGFDSITLADGRTGSFNAQIKEINDVANAGNEGRADVEGTVKGKSRVKISVKRAAIGAGIGMIIGAAVAGAQGAAAGAAIGAAVGVTTTLVSEGPNLEFKTGTQFTVITNGPSRRRESGEIAAQPPASHTDSAASPSMLKPRPPASPEPPSSSYRIYDGGLYSLSVPDNWHEHASRGTTILAPEGAYIEYQGQPGYTHCIMAGVIPAGGRNLQQATDALVGGLVRTNSYLRQQGIYSRGQIAARPALAVTLAGTWPATMRGEFVTVYTAMLRNGSFFFLFTTVAQEDVSAYRPVFTNMVRSVQIKD